MLNTAAKHRIVTIAQALQILPVKFCDASVRIADPFVLVRPPSV